MDLIFFTLGFVFLDNFLPTSFICVAALAVLLARRYTSVRLPDSLVDGCRKTLTAAAAVVTAFLLVSFFMHGQGMDRLALIPLWLGASPLILCGAIAHAFRRQRW
jgi:hypothetical protein